MEIAGSLTPGKVAGERLPVYHTEEKGGPMKRFVLFICMAVPVYFLAAQDVLPGYDGFWDRNRYVTVLDILEYYPNQLPYLRNEIYARYGRPFVTNAYQVYFNRQSWYRIRDDYTDDWLSQTDRYNAEVIRSIEQAPSVADSFALVERNVEYKGKERILVFGSSGVSVAENNEYFEVYGARYHSVQPYLIIGDWVIIYTPSYSVDAYQLDHKNKTFGAWDHWGHVAEKVFVPLVRAQERLRAGLR
jgi:hypothetical protein